MSNTIIFIGHDASRTGAPQSLLKIVRWFAANTKFEIIVLLNRDGPLRPDYEKIARTLVWHERLQFSFHFSLIQRVFLKIHCRRLLQFIRSSDPVCIFNNTGVNGDLVEVIRSETKAAVISRIPELEAFMRRNALGGSIQKILSLSSHIVAVSEAVRNNLHVRHGVPLERITIAYGACDVERIVTPGGVCRAWIKAARSDIVICGCGTMDWRKGYDLFVQAALAVCIKSNRLDVHFLWIGSAVSEQSRVEVQYELELLGLLNNLHHLGEVGFPSQFFVECNAFFLSSREDPFPLVMLEAARQALPIVCFEGSGGATEFVDSEIGAVVPMADVGAAVAALLALVDDKQLAVQKGLAAANRSRKFTVERMCTDVHSVVLAAIAGFDPQSRD